MKKLTNILRGGIRYRLFLLVGLITLPSAALLGLIYLDRYEARRNYALQWELEVAHGLAVTFNAYLAGIRTQTVAVGYAISTLPAQEEKRRTQLLVAAVHASPGVRNMSWVAANGLVLASSDPPLVGKNLAARAAFRAVLAGRDYAVGDLVEVGTVTPRATVIVVSAIRDTDGTLRGAVVSALEPTRLHEVVLTQKRPAEGALALFDNNGTLVYHSILVNPRWEERIAWRSGDAALRRVLQTRQDGAAIQDVKIRDTQRWVSARVPIPGTGWIAGAGRPVRVAFQEVRRGLITDALLGVTVYAFAFLFAYLVGRSITGPLRRLEDDARILGDGNLVSRDDPEAPTEVRTLRDTMLKMTAALLRRTDALRESESSLRTIFDSVYDGIVIHDGTGRIVDVNRRWLEMTGLGRHQVDGLTILDLSAGAPPIAPLIRMWQEVLGGQTKLFEWRGRNPVNGVEVDCEVFLSPIRLGGQDLVMGNVRDITEQKRVATELKRARDELEKRVEERTEELARAVEEVRIESQKRLEAVDELRRKEQLIMQQSRLAAMGEMMGNIAHHWRQPLNIIGLIIQDLALSFQEEKLTQQEMANQTERVMAVLGNLSRSIDDFRNLFAPDAARVVFSVREMVEKALSLLGGELKEIEVRVDASCDGGCTVEGFRNEYLQVLLNVLNNAWDVLRDRHVAAPRIEIRIFSDSGRSVATVADNGGGIEEGVMEKIFDPYFTTKGPESGTGMGLFMSKIIIEKNMGGTLTVRNTEAGAEFRIEI